MGGNVHTACKTVIVTQLVMERLDGQSTLVWLIVCGQWNVWLTRGGFHECLHHLNEDLEAAALLVG